MVLRTIHILIRIQAYAAQRLKSRVVAQIPGLIVALPNRSLTQKFLKNFDLLAIPAKGPALSTEWILTDVITKGKHEESGERALSKQSGVEG